MAKRIIGNPTITPMAGPDWKQDNPAKADFIKNKPTKLSEFDNDIGMQGGSVVDKGYVDELFDTLDTKKADVTSVYSKAVIDSKNDDIWDEIYYLNDCVDERTRVLISEYEDLVDNEGNTVFYHYMVSNTNTEQRLPELTRLSIEFEDAEYDMAYMSSLSFDSGATPTSIDYTNSGILNWVGTDCTTVDGLSIFQPSANTHYDIVFYFNGVQFIGLVNGFVPASGNEAV